MRKTGNHPAIHRPLGALPRAFRNGGAAFALTLLAMGGIHASAQGIGGHDSNAPVDFAADRIELQDRQDRVILSGDVRISQAGLNLRAARTLVNYSDAGSLSIQRITATGGVTITRADESARGNVAVYDFNRRIITLAGDVRLRRGSDTLNGGRLVIDLRTGISSIDGNAQGSSSVTGNVEQTGSGRVSGTFAVPQD
ncbi:LptA/OstA family protein [Pseudopontixanthobacter vadosimaris]|uniref:LptA/OstA family protein n=1 Tax=Pseudopontixanthobacter vadosimaris TaxID=2726450 RepID=UPI0014727FA5|nr:LptA/OstA family protein [Pseudopontixanthobacter vadosimaris]